MGIIQEMLTQDHEKKQTIDRKVSEQHIMPTQGEQQKANDVIRIISEKYAEKLKNHSIQDIEDELIEAIRKECEGLDFLIPRWGCLIPTFVLFLFLSSLHRGSEAPRSV